MNINIIRPAELSQSQISAWRDIQDSNISLCSPFFAPEFTQAVGSAVSNAYVAVCESDEHRTTAFFPFQRRKRTAHSIGGAISDYQGLVSPTSCGLSSSELLHGCGLDAFDFNHVPAAQSLFRNHSTTLSGSPYIDVSAGYEQLLSRRKAQGVGELASTLRKMRKLEREIGAVRFVADDPSDLAWQKLIVWKNAQYRRTNQDEALDRDWIVDTLARIRAVKEPRFSGRLSSLYADDKLLAVHFGMQSHAVWHYWFPAYDIEYQRYSPGLALLLRMAEHAAGQGIKMIDLGRGNARYKTALADGEIQLCEGSIERPSSASGVLRVARKVVERSWNALPVGRARSWPRRLFNRMLWRV